MKIRPGIVLNNGETYYPTGIEWILAFALKGCDWAIKALEEWRKDEPNRWKGHGI